MLLLAFLGGVLTILSPCILPVLPLVLARSGRSFSRETLPLLAGLALAFTAAALLATATAHWLLVANAVGRNVALVLLAVVGWSLLSDRMAQRVVQPLTRLGARFAVGATGSPLRNVGIGAAIGLLWAPCAGPILGLIIAAAATRNGPGAALLFAIFAAGAALSIALVMFASDQLLARLRGHAGVERRVRQGLGIATLVTVGALFLGWDATLFARGGVWSTTSAEAALVERFAPSSSGAAPAGLTLDEAAAADRARALPITLASSEGALPGFDGGTDWMNSAPLTVDALRGKVVLVDFWTYGCYNCLNALPHIKALYAKYKDRGFVVIGVHTPEFAQERVPDNVRSRVASLGIEYPVVIDNDTRIWRAFHNQFWPAAFYADASGHLRFHHFGEGRYDEQDRLVARLLDERDAAAHTTARGTP